MAADRFERGRSCGIPFLRCGVSIGFKTLDPIANDALNLCPVIPIERIKALPIDSREWPAGATVKRPLPQAQLFLNVTRDVFAEGTSVVEQVAAVVRLAADPLAELARTDAAVFFDQSQPLAVSFELFEAYLLFVTHCRSWPAPVHQPVLTARYIEWCNRLTMHLKTYIKSLPDEAAREAFASRCGSTIGHLRNVMYGFRPCAPELAMTIEVESGGAVMRWELRPNDWHRIWRDLIGADGAPEPPATKPMPEAA